MKIIIKKILKKNTCLTTSEGLEIFNIIKSSSTNLDKNEKIEIDFSDINMLTVTFLNACYGRIFELDKIIINKIILSNINNKFKYKFDYVKKNAISFYNKNWYNIINKDKLKKYKKVYCKIWKIIMIYI